MLGNKKNLIKFKYTYKYKNTSNLVFLNTKTFFSNKNFIAQNRYYTKIVF